MDDVRQSRHLSNSTLPIPYTEKFAIEQIEQNRNLCENQSKSYNFSVSKLNLPIVVNHETSSSKDQVIGAILIRPSDLLSRSFESVEIGYVMDPDYQGKRLMSACMSIFLKHVFQRFPNLNEITAIISDENLASLRVVKKLGFEKNLQIEPIVGKRHVEVLHVFVEKEEVVSHGYSLKKADFKKCQLNRSRTHITVKTENT